MKNLKTNKLFFLAVLFIIHALYFLKAISGANIYTADSVEYLAQADNILTYGSFYAAPWHWPTNPDWFTFRPPVYACFIILCKTIYNHHFAILAVQNLLSIATINGLEKFIQQFKFNTGYTQLIIIFATLLYPSQLILCNMVMSDVLFQFIIFYAFYFTYNLRLKPNFKTAFITAFIFVIGMLTKPVSFMLGFTLMLVLAFFWFKQNKLKYLLPFMLLPITYHAYCSYNKYITGYYHYTSVTPYFVLKYMAKYTNAQLYGENYADSVQTVIINHINQQKTYKDRYNLMLSEGKNIVKQHLPVFAWFNIKGWFIFFIDPGRFEWYHFLNIDEGNFPGLYHLVNTKGFIYGILHFIKIAPTGILLVLLVSLLFNAIVFVLLFTFLFNNRIDLFLRFLVFLFVGYIAVSTGVLGLARYRLAIAPQLWLAMIFSVHYLVKKLRHDY